MLARVARAGPAALPACAAAALRCLVATTERAGGAGALSGLRYLAKDLLDTAGRTPSCGLPDSDDAATTPTRDAEVLAMLDGAGARRLGFAEMTPLAFEPSGGNPARGRPLNPWDPDRICGGSSSGSAVAVAAGLCDIALGSDTAGSLRIPAQGCGVSAWKPTPGLVPIAGAMALAPSLDVLGFLARDAESLKRVAGVFAPVGSRPIRKIAVAQDLIDQADADIRQALAAAAGVIGKTGRSLSPQPLAALLAACDEPVLELLLAEGTAQHGWRLERDGLEATLAARLRKGLTISPERAEEARQRLRAIAGALTLFRHHDAILLPVTPIPTPPVSRCEPASPEFAPRTLYALSAYTRFVNGLGLPAVALPCGFDRNGMPIAAQLVGPPGGDRALLALAAEIQSDTDWHGREPAGLAAILEAAR